VVATVVDLGVYLSLFHLVFQLDPAAIDPGVGPKDLAKASGFVFGTLVSYLLNRWWTFESKDGGAGQIAAFLTLYGATFLMNVAVNHVLLTATGWVLASWFVATACSTVANFVGNKFWVFKPA